MNILIGPLEYYVSFNAASEQEEGRRGSTHHQAGTIQINPYLSESQRAVTLLHETMHACAEAVGFSEGITLTEEEFINRIAPILLDTLWRNEDLRSSLKLCNA